MPRRVLDRDRDAPLRDPEEEVGRPVERVDDPAQPARAGRVRALLAEHAVVGPRGQQRLADQLLGGDVGGGDEIGRAALRLDVDRRARRTPRAAGRRPRARSARTRARSSFTASGIRSAHGRSCSICAASESSVASSSGRPTSWTASGKPSGVKPIGTEAAGWPVWLNGGAVGHPARVAVEGPERAAPLVGADRDRAAREHRREQDVGVLEQAADPLRASAPPRRRPARATGGAIAAPEAHESARAPRRGAPGAAIARALVVDPAQVARGERRPATGRSRIALGDLVPEPAQQLRGGVERPALLRVRRAEDRRRELGRDRDPQAPGRAASTAGASGSPSLGGVDEQRRVGDAANDRAVDRECRARGRPSARTRSGRAGS